MEIVEGSEVHDLLNDIYSDNDAVNRAITQLNSLDAERKKREQENERWHKMSSDTIKRYENKIFEIVETFDKTMEGHKQLGNVINSYSFDYEVYVEKAPDVRINYPVREWIMYDGRIIELNIRKGILVDGIIPREGFAWHDAHPILYMGCPKSGGYGISGFGIDWKILSKDDAVNAANELFDKFMTDYFLSVDAKSPPANSINDTL